jgi:D-alanyl-D-alanine carboxypeptidase/D-alanyl-D-alanine-endopeptidase (penicillin-binding protein 4)
MSLPPFRSLFAAFLIAVPLCAQQAFDARFHAIMNRPEFKHARFGVEFYSLDDGKVLYSWNPDELFVPGSTTKILTIGTALELLGPDFRFHTKIYKTGPVRNGTLHGDLVLVASGDPDLSNRIQPDGTLAFENEDHSYDGFAAAAAVPGDPLAVIKELSSKVAASGIKRVQGRVLADVSLFPEGDRELGTGVVISPLVVNDNLVDVLVTPAAQDGQSAVLSISPLTSYVQIRNEVKTSPAGGKTDLQWKNDVAAPNGTHSVTLVGNIPLNAKPKLRTYQVAIPSKFAEVVLTECLKTAGVSVDATDSKHTPDPSQYTSENLVADHLSPPLTEEAKVTLKVSQNLHASMFPSIVGAYREKGTADPLQSGFDQEHALLEKADLDLNSAVQSDGAGGAALFTPDFMVHFLLHLTKQPFSADFKKALPILGRDGTLFEIQTASPAAGHVFAKTGTYASGNALTHGGVIDGKGLAGFIDTKDGRHLAFAAYINFVPLRNMDEKSTQMVGQAVGEIAAAAYEGFE